MLMQNCTGSQPLFDNVYVYMEKRICGELLEGFGTSECNVRECKGQMKIVVPNSADNHLVMWEFRMDGVSEDHMTWVNFPSFMA